MMRKLYDKDGIIFALVWIGLYVIGMNIALQFAGGLDNLADKTALQLLPPVALAAILALSSTIWVYRNGLAEHFGLQPFRGSRRTFLWFVPLVFVSCINFKNGLALSAPLGVSVLMALNLAVSGYVEEIIFRGFLFRGMAKNGLRSAIIVSAVTFGAGHIVNLANTADTTGVLLQVCYAMVVGLLYTIIVYKDGSLWPCIISHMFVNGSSVFAAESGPFADLIAAVTGNSSPLLAETVSSALLMAVSGAYALWLWKKA